ncbi:exo-alpha-sialidase [Actinomycetes bacterium KLBMP 9797]
MARGMAKMALFSVVAAAALVSPAAPAAAAGTFDESTLWDSTEVDQYASFHVHGLVVVPAGTPVPATGGTLAADVVLAFTEGRFAESDAGAKDLLVRRSADAGRTWSASAPVVPADPAHSWGNPTPLVDERTGAVFLFYKGSGGSLFVKRSDDAGATWRTPVDLSSLYASNPNGWTLNGPVPGHGIQLDSGRLLMPVLHRAPDPNPNYGDDMLYSDDHGVTWRRSAPIPFSVNYPVNEARVYQRTDGAVVLNGRWGAGGTRYRITSTSTDGGTTWSKPVIDGATGQFVAVDAGLIRYPGGRLLHSRPDASARENMTVSISYDDGASYRYSRVVNSGPSYYSDLAALSDGTILLVYGRDGDSAAFPERVALSRFDLEWLTDGRDSLATGPGITTREVELATAAARTGAATAPQVVADANARGGRTLRYPASAVGGYVEAPFEVPVAGSYEVAVRYHRLADRGRVRVSVDGIDLPHGVVDPTLTVGEGYQVYPLGRMALATGTHWIRFTLAAAGRGGGMVIAPDQLTLVSGGGGVAAADPPRVVADNDSPASVEVVAGTWNRATGVASYYGQSYLTHPAGTGTSRVRFRPDVPMSGVYQVAVWHTAHENRASNAPFVVTHAAGQATVRVDQRVRGGQWVSLGTFPFLAGTAATIDVTDAADGYVIADAVRLVRTGVVADNDVSGTFDIVSGTWNRATGVPGYYGDSYRTHPAGTGTARVRFRPDVPETGAYQVAVWYTADPNRASNAPFVVTHAQGQATVRVDQRVRGGQWVVLGTYPFVAGGPATVELSDAANGYVIADAVRLVLP